MEFGRSNYFGAKGERVYRVGGYQVIKLNDRGCFGRRYFGVAGEPSVYEDGYSTCVMTYDEKGNKTEERYLGVDDSLTLSVLGYAFVQFRYNRKNLLISESYFDKNGEPTAKKRVLRGLSSGTVGAT